MPLSVIRQNLQGKRYEEIHPLNAELNRLLPQFDDMSYPLLRLIDPYGNTLFSSNQMHGFLPEWDRLIADIHDVEDRKLLSQVRDMAETCKKNPHTFIRFRGD